MIDNLSLEILFSILEFLPLKPIIYLLKTNRSLYEKCKNVHIQRLIIHKMGIEYPILSNMKNIRIGAILKRHAPSFKIPYKSQYIIIDIIDLKYRHIAKVRRISYIKDKKAYCNYKSEEIIVHNCVEENCLCLQDWNFYTNGNQAKFIFL